MIKYDRNKKKLIIPNGLGNDVDGAYFKGYEDGYNDALRKIIKGNTTVDYDNL